MLWRLDEFRHTRIPLLLMHELARWNPQFDWAHKFYHTNNWFAIAARHFFDELTLGQNAIEFHIATNVILETGFTNLQFAGLAHDPEYAQYLIDKWLWRNWHLFSILTGITMDYLTAPQQRTASFKDFIEEWIVDQFFRTLDEFGLKKPWYWDIFLEELEIYHHMIYASAYSYRAMLWFDFVMPSTGDREWLRRKYPKYWDDMADVWDQIGERWKSVGPGQQNEMLVQGTVLPTFCDLCQLPLSAGSPRNNTANVLAYHGRDYIFCSETCRWIFLREPER